MSKKYNKKINCILRNIIIVFIILFFNFNVYATSIGTEDSNSPETLEIEAESKQNEEGTTIPGEETEDEKKAKEIDEKAAIGLNQTEDQDSGITMEDIEEKNYTIEDIVYNRVPIFDINVFSDTSAGVKIPDNSIEGILKKIVAIWYVSLRNVAFIILAILIIYTGMMMAISTIADEKATYKKRLIGWIKGIVILAFIHYIIYIVINLNQNIVNTIAQTSGKESQIYNTIKTRAMDTRLSIGFPATLLYLTLIIMWLRFIWTYIKRKFNVEFLIILAPLVVAKYTYELSSGKKSKILSNWFQRFTTAVFIQSIHALFYTIFVGTVLEISTDNLLGFVISLMVMNFMLSADKLFTSIFKFNFSGKDIDDLNRPFVPREDLNELFVTYSVAKRIIPNGVEAVKRTGYSVGADISKIYNNQMDKLDQKNGRDNRAIIRNKLNAPKDAIDDWALNRIKIKDKDYKNPITKSIGQTITSGKKAMRQRIILRKMSRQQGETKDFVKRTIKMKHKETKRRFTSNYKFIKDVAVGGVEAILAIPIGVNYGADSGLTVGVNATNNLIEAKELGSRDNKKKNLKYSYQLNDVIQSVETVYDETNKISEDVNNLSEEEKVKVKESIKKYNKLGMNKYEIANTIKNNQEFTQKSISEDKDIEKIIKTIEDKLPDNISEKEKKDIKNRAIDIIKENKRKSIEEENKQRDKEDESKYKYNNKNEKGNYSYNIDEIAEGINSAIIKHAFGDKNEEIGKSVEKISSANSKEVAKKDSFGKILDLNKFADTL